MTAVVSATDCPWCTPAGPCAEHRTTTTNGDRPDQQPLPPNPADTGEEPPPPATNGPGRLPPPHEQPLRPLEPVDPAQKVEPDPDIDTFLNAPEPEYDWLVPGLVERGDRIILTGPEGGGKSTLLRQVGVQGAAGIHPFTGDKIDPLNVFLCDLENSERHDRRQLRPLRIQAGDRLDRGKLRIHVRPAGIDLLRDEDVAWLEERIAANRPDLFITGPLYKLAGGDPTSEEVARRVAQVLDELRTRHTFALIVEAHSPYGTAGGKRPTRPYGASLWSRWPEFGLHLSEQGAVTHWRGARDERAWPAYLKRGGTWPWTKVESAEERWAAIVDHCSTLLVRPSIRDLVTATGIALGSVHRTIEAHRDEWEALFPEADE